MPASGNYVYPNEVKRIFDKPGGPVGKVVRRIALDIAKEAKRLAELELGNHPNDKARTGDYARGFEVLVTNAKSGQFAFVVRNKKFYAKIIEDGSRAHIIRARRVQYLQFRGRDGRWNKVTVVSHPGTRPFKILNRAAENVVRKM